MEEKLKMIAQIFKDSLQEQVEDNGTPVQHGRYFGGEVNGRKFMYSETMINEFPIEKLEKVIRKQTGL